jgi:hypothetical protein
MVYMVRVAIEVTKYKLRGTGHKMTDPGSLRTIR